MPNVEVKKITSVVRLLAPKNFKAGIEAQRPNNMESVGKTVVLIFIEVSMVSVFTKLKGFLKVDPTDLEMLEVRSLTPQNVHFAPL